MNVCSVQACTRVDNIGHPLKDIKAGQFKINSGQFQQWVKLSSIILEDNCHGSETELAGVCLKLTVLLTQAHPLWGEHTLLLFFSLLLLRSDFFMTLTSYTVGTLFRILICSLPSLLRALLIELWYVSVQQIQSSSTAMFCGVEGSARGYTGMGN